VSTDPSSKDKPYGSTILLLIRIATASSEKFYEQYMNIYPALHGTLYFHPGSKLGSGAPTPDPGSRPLNDRSPFRSE